MKRPAALWTLGIAVIVSLVVIGTGLMPFFNSLVSKGWPDTEARITLLEVVKTSEEGI